MKNLKLYVVAALAGVGAAQVIRWLNLGVIHVLVMSNGQWTVAEAAKASPWILGALISGTAMSLYGMWADNQQYKHSALKQQKTAVKTSNERKAG